MAAAVREEDDLAAADRPPLEELGRRVPGRLGAEAREDDDGVARVQRIFAGSDERGAGVGIGLILDGERSPSESNGESAAESLHAPVRVGPADQQKVMRSLAPPRSPFGRTSPAR